MNKLCGAPLFCAGYCLPHMPRPARSRRSPQGRGGEVLILLRCKQFDANIRGLHI